MPDLPETRESLLVRVKDPSDYEAWNQFVSVYRPVIYRLARKRGLQDANAHDLTQQVLMAVAKAVDGWKVDPSRGRFRSWLMRIAHNAIINALTRARPDVGIGGSSFLELLDQQPQRDPSSTGNLNREYHRGIFRWAVQQIRSEFHESTWNAFWLTTVETQGVEQASAALNKSVGSIYAARSRVMRRLKQKVCEYEREAFSEGDN